MGEEKGEMLVKSYLAIAIADLQEFFNVGKTMNESQIAETVTLIVEWFWHLKLEDFKLYCVKFKNGDYGKLFDRLDGQVILSNLTTFDLERQEYAERLNDKKQREVSEVPEIDKNTSAEYLKLLKGVVEKHEKGETQDLEQGSSGTFKSHQEKQVDVMQRWMHQFDNFYARKYGNPGPIRTITIGKYEHIDMNKFLELKLANKDK